MKLKDVILLTFIILCFGGALGLSYGSTLYDAINYGDFTVENNTVIGLNLTVNESIIIGTDDVFYVYNNDTCIITVANGTSFSVCE